MFLPSPNPPSYVAFISSPILHDQLDYKRSFYANPEADMVLERPYPYLKDRTMTRFVDDCTSTFLEIYAALQDNVDLKNSTTALDLVAEDQFAPYSFPLGDEPA